MTHQEVERRDRERRGQALRPPVAREEAVEPGQDGRGREHRRRRLRPREPPRDEDCQAGLRREQAQEPSGRSVEAARPIDARPPATRRPPA